MIHVLAIITAKPGLLPKVLEAFKANVPNVLIEDGCIEYGAAVDVANARTAFGPDTFVVIEKWRDQDALRAHAVAPHMKAYAATSADWVASRAIHILDPA